jgi:hypothetical protein
MSNADDAGPKWLCASRAALGAGYLTWSAWAARQRRGAPPVRAGTLSSRRDRWARSLARYLAPSWLPGGPPPGRRRGR